MPKSNRISINDRYYISPMSESDIDAVMELEEDSFISPWTEESILGQMKNDFSHIWTIIDNNITPDKLIGFISYWVVADTIDLHQICVARNQRGEGLGLLLMRFLTAIAKKQNIKEIHLEVRTGNIPAIGLYERCGFQTTGIRPKYYSDTGEDAILMSLNLQQ